MPIRLDAVRLPARPLAAADDTRGLIGAYLQQKFGGTLRLTTLSMNPENDVTTYFAGTADWAKTEGTAARLSFAGMVNTDVWTGHRQVQDLGFKSAQVPTSTLPGAVARPAQDRLIISQAMQAKFQEGAPEVDQLQEGPVDGGLIPFSGQATFVHNDRDDHEKDPITESVAGYLDPKGQLVPGSFLTAGDV